jgi:hypothetical protein
MSNAERIVRELDLRLDHEVRLILYGRAALALGFEKPPPATLLSLDVDVIIPMSEVEQWQDDQSFWTAQEATNRALSGDGLYITHLFTAADVVLRRCWEEHLEVVSLAGLRNLRLRRPATIDLVLTKMMRGVDPIDRDDLQFLVKTGRITVADLEGAFAEVMLPAVPELKELFEQARPVVLELAAANEPKH